jgi:hypothetical protein
MVFQLKLKGIKRHTGLRMLPPQKFSSLDLWDETENSITWKWFLFSMIIFFIHSILNILNYNIWAFLFDLRVIYILKILWLIWSQNMYESWDCIQKTLENRLTNLKEYLSFIHTRTGIHSCHSDKLTITLLNLRPKNSLARNLRALQQNSCLKLLRGTKYEVGIGK